MDNVGILEGHYDVNIETKKKKNDQGICSCTVMDALDIRGQVQVTL